MYNLTIFVINRRKFSKSVLTPQNFLIFADYRRNRLLLFVIIKYFFIMTQFLLNIEDPKDVNLIKKLLKKFDGVTLRKTYSRHTVDPDKAKKGKAAGRGK